MAFDDPPGAPTARAGELAKHRDMPEDEPLDPKEVGENGVDQPGNGHLSPGEGPNCGPFRSGADENHVYREGGWWFAGGIGFAWIQFVLERVWYEDKSGTLVQGNASHSGMDYRDPDGGDKPTYNYPQPDVGGRLGEGASPWQPTHGGRHTDGPHGHIEEKYKPHSKEVDARATAVATLARWRAAFPAAGIPPDAKYVVYRQDFWTFKIRKSDRKVVEHYYWYNKIMIDLDHRGREIVIYSNAAKDAEPARR